MMEQGSSSAPNQKRLSFTDELRAIMNSSSQDLSPEKESSYSIPETSEYQSSNFDGALNLSQTEQIQQIGGPSSFSRGSLQEEMLSQFDGANLMDLSAAYSLANLHSRPQLYQGNNAMISAGEESNYGEMINRYNVSVSNMVPQFHLLTSNSSGHGGLQIGSSQTLVPFESSIIDSSVNTGTHNVYSAVHEAQNNAMPPENLASFRSMKSQALPYPITAPNGFDVGVDISNNAKTPTSALKAPFGSSMTDPLIDVAAQQAQNNATVESSFSLRSVTGQGISYPMNTANGFEFGSGSSSNGPTTSTLKRKMPCQDDMTTNYQSWNSFGRSLHRYSSSSYDGGRYTLYDKRYEDVGLPVDPHLRIFIAGNGNGDSSSSRRKD